MAILVIADHDGVALKPATLNAVTAASQIGGSVDLLLGGQAESGLIAQARAITNVSNVLHAKDTAFNNCLAEALAPLVVDLGSDYTHLVFPATSEGKSLAPRVAALLDSAQLSEITAVIDANTFERPIYAGNIIARVESLDKVKVLTVRSTAFEAAPTEGGTANLVELDKASQAVNTAILSEDAVKSDRPELTTAKVIVSGGRALGSSEKYQEVMPPLADKLGAALGASRAAVDSGFAPNDFQVGQTGKIVAPDLYVAIGISGAIQHLAGMKDSKVIVAINKDPDAPIFGVADYGIVGDLFKIVPEMVSQLG